MQVYFTPDTVAGTSPSCGKSLFSSQDGGGKSLFSSWDGEGARPSFGEKDNKKTFFWRGKGKISLFKIFSELMGGEQCPPCTPAAARPVLFPFKHEFIIWD